MPILDEWFCPQSSRLSPKLFLQTDHVPLFWDMLVFLSVLFVMSKLVWIIRCYRVVIQLLLSYYLSWMCRQYLRWPSWLVITCTVAATSCHWLEWIPTGPKSRRSEQFPKFQRIWMDLNGSEWPDGDSQHSHGFSTSPWWLQDAPSKL